MIESIKKIITNKKTTNYEIVKLFFSLNSKDDMATKNPTLFMVFAKVFFERKIDLTINN